MARDNFEVVGVIVADDIVGGTTSEKFNTVVVEIDLTASEKCGDNVVDEGTVDAVASDGLDAIGTVEVDNNIEPNAPEKFESAVLDVVINKFDAKVSDEFEVTGVLALFITLDDVIVDEDDAVDAAASFIFDISSDVPFATEFDSKGIVVVLASIMLKTDVTVGKVDMG